MEIAANGRYSSYVNISGYERASLSADAEVVARVCVSHDAFTWFSVEEREYVIAARTAWAAPTYIFDYKYLKLQARPTTTRRLITVTLSNELEQGIPSAAGAGQFPVSTADDVSWTPEPAGAGMEFPSLDAGTPKVFRYMVSASAPAVGDDVADGYQVGSLWLETTANRIFVCTDVSAGAAVWQQLLGAPTNTLGAPAVIRLSATNVVSLGLPNTGVVAIKTANYELVAADQTVIGNSTDPLQFTLPAATGTGNIHLIKNINTGALTVVPTGDDLIDGDTSFILDQWDSITVQDSAADRWVIC